MIDLVRAEHLIESGILSVEDGNHGEYRPRPDEFVESGGTAFIRAADLDNGVIDFAGAGSINLVALSRIRKGIGRPLDVLLSHKGTVGKVAQAPQNSPPFVCSPQTTFWRSLDVRTMDPRFLRFALEAPVFVAQLEAIKGESDMAPYVSLTQQRLLSIPLPGIDVQRAIAEILGALDGKIAANTKLATTADELAQSLVDMTLSSGTREVSVAEIAEFHNRKRVPLSSRDREVRVGTVPYYGANGVIDTVDEAIFDGVYVLVGEDGSVITPYGTPVITYIWGPAWVNNHAHVLTGSTVSTDLLYYLVRGTRIESIVTGAVQPKVSMGNLKSVMLDVPLNEALPRLEHEVGLLRARCRSAAEESGRLEGTRNTLLPAVMSGRLTVRDAEAAVERALDGGVEPEALVSGKLW